MGILEMLSQSRTIIMQKKIQLSKFILITLTALSLSSCGSNNKNIKETHQNQEARFEVKSQCGNDANYSINGKSYQVLPTAANYEKDATASWYGAAYQGSQTASCETFDMFSYTAAHRTLPLPSYVKVTNKKNGKSVIVKVNDRGPFDSNNEIELSFAAANAIGMVKSKIASVHIKGLTPDQINGSFSKPENSPTPNKTTSSQSTTYAKATSASDKVFYIVAGTYRTNKEAIDMFVRLSSIGVSKTEMATAYRRNQELYMVRVGPLYSQDQIDNIKDRLTQDGLTRFKVVND